MKLLELFSGTGSVRKTVGEKFDEIVSIDILPKFSPTECVNILDWNYKKYPPHYFESIWSSPPCTHYSTAKTKGIRDIEGSNKIVLRTLEIIEYFKPNKWFMENPQTGLLKNQEFMKDIPFIDVDYCQYGYDYRKRTRIWTNQIIQGKLCDKKTCTKVRDNRHFVCVGSGRITDRHPTKNEKYSIPSLLILELFE